MKKRILDSGAFIENLYTEGITSELITKETQVPPTIEILTPKTEFIEKIKSAARETGDDGVLSKADIEVLALGLQMDGIVVSNDFAVQNVAEHIGLSWEGAGKSMTKKIEWVWYCPGCKKLRQIKGKCDFCGTETKRRPKTKKSCRKHL